MAEPARYAQRVAHQGGADAAVAAVGGDRHRAQQQGRLAVAARDVPEPGGADHALAVGGDEGEAFGRQTALAQPLGGLARPQVAEGLVEQRLARRGIGRSFATNGDHVRSFPARCAQARSPELIQSHEGKAEAALAASGVCQMW